MTLIACSRAALIALVLGGGEASAQATLDFGLPPPSGSQNPVLPPPSGSQNPVLPPPSGQRYVPGTGGRFGDRSSDRPGTPRSAPRIDSGLTGSISPATRALQDAPVDRISDLGPALRRCWEPPGMDGPNDGAMATVRFSLRRDGTIFGQPRLTWETRPADRDLQERFSSSVLSAFRSCAPLRLSERFGAAIAGRPFTIRFHGRAPSTEKAI